MPSISTRRRRKLMHRKRMVHSFLTMRLSSNPTTADYYGARGYL